MTFDPSELTPAPWEVWLSGDHSGDGHLVLDGNPSGDATETDIAFIALARAAYDVMMRRKLTVDYFEGRWTVHGFATWPVKIRRPFGIWLQTFRGFDCPFTALVEADKWLAGNEKAGV